MDAEKTEAIEKAYSYIPPVLVINGGFFAVAVHTIDKLKMKSMIDDYYAMQKHVDEYRERVVVQVCRRRRKRRRKSRLKGRKRMKNS